MIVCKICDKKLVTPKQMEKHLLTHEAPVEGNGVAPAEVVAPVEAVAPVAEPVSEKVVLRFKVPVEVAINGVKYEGKVIEAPNMSIATEIARIIRESAYGDVLER